MTVHVSVRSISALLLLSVSLLGLPADALAQFVVAPQKTAPTLAERLDRLAAEFEGRMPPDTFTLQPSTESGRGQ